MGNSQSEQKNQSQIFKGNKGKLLVGFQNKPLTLCYANSIFQVLFHHPIFCSILQKYGYKFDFKQINYFRQYGGLLGNLNDLYKQYKSAQSLKSISTQRIMSIIQKKSGIFQRDYHQDSHQLFIWLLNQVNDQLKKIMKNQKIDNKNLKQNKIQTDLQKVFISKRITQIKCLKCQNITENQVQDIDLSLFLPQPNVSLNNCIQQYSKVQLLTGNNKFKCDKCNKLENAEKRTLIKTLPKFLTIHLRRFKYDQQKKGMIKLNWLIPFPFKLKMKTNYSKINQKNISELPQHSNVKQFQQEQKIQICMYKLVGVIAHIGQGQNYGHYLCYIKIDNQWYQFNDDEINKIDDYMLESLWGYKGLTKCAYMLFYIP